jgi:hypothetical protein
MRVSRVLVAAALAVTSAAIVQAPSASAVSPPYNVITGSADLASGDGVPFLVTSAATDWSVTGTAGTVTFHASPGGDTSRTLDIAITPNTSGPLTTTTYNVAPTANATDAGFAVSEGGNPCLDPSGGTMTVEEVAFDGSNNITAFAATYNYTCNDVPYVSGELRFNANTDYRAALQSQATWDFGRQLVGAKDVPKKFVFTNRGSVAQSFTGASISQTYSSFGITSNNCTTAAVPPGGTCSITVTPHPKKYFDRTFVPEVGTLRLRPDPLTTPDALPLMQIPLQVEGSDLPEAYLRPGAGWIAVNWGQGQLPEPIGAGYTGVQVWRGTSKTSLTKLRTVSPSYSKTTDYSVTPGRTYYYRLRPVLPGGVLGDFSPIMAAIAWPKYSPGMYHRLPASVRFTADHVVQAGHPFSLQVLGQHGVPGSGVSAVALNLTAHGSTAGTQLRVYPAGTSQPKPADLIVKPGAGRTNLVLAKVGRHGRVLIATAQGSVHVDVDVTGYYSGARLAHKYGKGAALQEYAYPGTIMDTKAFKIGAVPHGYYVNAPVNFSQTTTPHVTSLLVEVTAYGSEGSGTITGFQTNGRASHTNVLSYSPNTWTSNTTIIRAGNWYGSNGNVYPSVSFLNRGPKPVQLIVSILGYYDDDTFLFGQRYTPTAPFHLFGKTLHADTTTKFNPGTRHAGYWTTTFNTKIAATNPTRTTWLGIRAIGGGPAPKHGQVDVRAHVNVASTTLPPTGVGNEMAVHNAYGTVTVNMWSFGRFDAFPVPRNTPGYTTTSTAAVTALATPSRVAVAAPRTAVFRSGLTATLYR